MAVFLYLKILVEKGGPVQTLRNFRGDQSGHLEILEGTSRDTLTFSENIYLPADT